MDAPVYVVAEGHCSGRTVEGARRGRLDEQGSAAAQRARELAAHGAARGTTHLPSLTHLAR